MPRRNGDLLVAALLGGISAALLEIVENVAFRVVVAIPLLMVLPGYALCAAIFARHRLGRAHVVLLSLGLSLACTAVGSVFLGAVSVDLRSWVWILLPLCVLWTGCGVAFVRRTPASAAGFIPFRPFQVRPRDAILLLLGASIAAAAVAFGRTPLSAKNVEGYTAFWIAPPSAEQSGDLRVGVASSELRDQTYRIVVKQGERFLYERQTLRLAPGESWTTTIPAPKISHTGAVTARLYRSQRPGEVYRLVRVWLAPSQGPA